MAIDPTISLKATVPTFETPDLATNLVNATKIKTAQMEQAGKKLELTLKALGQAQDQPSYDQAKKWLTDQGIDVSTAPQVFDPEYIRQQQMAALDIKDKLELAMKQYDRDWEKTKFAETVRHNQATESVAQDRADTANAIADLKLKMLESGQLGLKDRVGVEKTLRDDYQSQSKEWQTVANFYQRGLEGAKAAEAGNPQGDQTLIYSFMKLQDPTSVVMPGEYATAGSFRGVPEAIIQTYNKAVKGDSLSPQQRANISQQLEAIFRQKANQQIKNETNYRDLAGRSGADAQNVMIGVPTVTQISPTWPVARAPNPNADISPAAGGLLPPPDPNYKGVRAPMAPNPQAKVKGKTSDPLGIR